MNPWTALMEPIRSRPGDRLRAPPEIPSRKHSADGYTIRAAAALVVTYTAKNAVPDIRLLPIVAVEFHA